MPEAPDAEYLGVHHLMALFYRPIVSIYAYEMGQHHQMSKQLHDYSRWLNILVARVG